MNRNVLFYFSLIVVILGVTSCGKRESSEKTGSDSQVSKKVFAFYYGWYGNPDFSNQWIHWRDVNKEEKDIGGSINYPELGPYDSRNPEVVEQHCSWAKQVGIDVFIASWFGPNEITDKSLPVVLESAKKNDLKVTAYYETTDDSKEQGLKYLNYLLDNYTDHPAWLKINGQPVVFVYGRAVNEIGLDGWKWMIQKVNEQRSQDVVFIGDRISKEASEIFHGLHTYNITGAIQGKSKQEIRKWAGKNYPEWVTVAGDKISCLTIIPGFDDTELDRPKPRPTTSRHNGETYRILWEEAIAANPDWILITSFNEWHEGSEIEPSVENGNRALNITEKFTDKFKTSD